MEFDIGVYTKGLTKMKIVYCLVGLTLARHNDFAADASERDDVNDGNLRFSLNKNANYSKH